MSLRLGTGSWWRIRWRRPWPFVGDRTPVLRNPRWERSSPFSFFETNVNILRLGVSDPKSSRSLSHLSSFHNILQHILAPCTAPGYLWQHSICSLERRMIHFRNPSFVGRFFPIEKTPEVITSRCSLLTANPGKPAYSSLKWMDRKACDDLRHEEGFDVRSKSCLNHVYRTGLIWIDKTFDRIECHTTISALIFVTGQVETPEAFAPACEAPGLKCLRTLILPFWWHFDWHPKYSRRV